MNQSMNTPRRTSGPHGRTVRTARFRRGFSMIELLIALSITSMLLTAVFVALDASFKAYRSTAESSSRHTIARLTMHNLLAMIRTGTEFGPYPDNVVTDPIIKSDYFEFVSPDGLLIRVEYRLAEESLYVIVDPGAADEIVSVLLSGVQVQQDELGNPIPPFTLHYEIGPNLYRATIDLTVISDSGIELRIEGDDVPPLRLVASMMPRNNL